ncbi:beta-galactosidase [candidate division LCP-89 bacterium B3_LCP]|uniref:Beta-galactosidase n=1 Tax=candidate division LCP-89 bacterium B3_LCP TaxID=2012998 RepID=A0A532USJ1_UNCL8|nr:MAG: beta-galactosidase [candidate division LCP-89 bacterium B3_LCP]
MIKIKTQRKEYRMNYRILSFTSCLIALVILLTVSDATARVVKPINDNWEFIKTDFHRDFDNPDHSWQKVTIPHTWNNKDIQSGSKPHYGTGWYRRDLIIERDNSNKQYFLRFDGVGQYAEVYINNQYVGEHLGSYSAFVFNITRFLNKEGSENTILVRVNNELNDSYPKDNWLFGIYGGIYRGVSLTVTNELHLSLTDYASSGVYVHQKEVSNKKATLNIVTLLKNETSIIKQITVRNRLLANNLKVVADHTEEKTLYPGSMFPVTSYLYVKKPRLWNGKNDPYLYSLETELLHNGNVVDKITQTIGIRSHSIDTEKGFILNGEPYRLYGVCRHQDWEDLGNALLPEHHKKDMDLINETGATSIRLAHYQQADYMYSLADSMGILIWAEIPFVNGYKDNADDNALQQLTELIKQNFNHPSIFVWGLHNEVVKGHNITRPVNLTKKLHNLAKDLDPSRHTVAVSNQWWHFDYPINELADLQGFNQYTGWYGGQPHELNNWIENYHAAKPDVRISVSEYGAGGNIAHQANDVSIPPPPKSQFFPEAYHTHYHEVTWSAIKNSPFIWASYVWNMFDFSVPEWNRGGIKGRNHKGLVTYDRKTQKDAFYWYKANWSEDPVLYISGRRFNERKVDKSKFTVYCNFADPVLELNGVVVEGRKQGGTSVHYIWEDVPLRRGENIIKSYALKDGERMEDQYTIIAEF